MSAYSVIQYHQSTSLFSDTTDSAVVTLLGDSLGTSRWAEVSQICIMILSTVAFLFLAYKLYLEFGWHIYKKIGADLAMRGKDTLLSMLLHHLLLLLWKHHHRPLQNVSDLYDAPQIRFFLFPWVLGSILGFAHSNMVAGSRYNRRKL